MFARRTLQRTSWAALIAVLMAVLLPTLGHATGKFAAPAGGHELCTLDGIKTSPAAPGETALQQKPCVFCTSSVPLFADAHAPRVVALAAPSELAVRWRPTEFLPRDAAATLPLSPRAPPAR